MRTGPALWAVFPEGKGLVGKSRMEEPSQEEAFEGREMGEVLLE